VVDSQAWDSSSGFGLADAIEQLMRCKERLAEMIDAYRRQHIDIKAVLGRVAARGGPSAQWRVDLNACEATWNLVTVNFYVTADGEFCPNSYSRLDGRDLDTEQDCHLLEDAYACIAEAIAEAKRKSN
jgi:hypothetical protein